MTPINTCVILQAGTDNETIGYINEAYHSSETGELVYSVELETGEIVEDVTRSAFVYFAA